MLPNEGVSTHSMLTSFRRCPRQAMYKYVDQIGPRVVSRPLKLGGWVHTLLEAHYKGLDWREQHEDNKEGFFEEEIDSVAAAAERLMRSYLWYYQLEKKYGWKVLEIELPLQTLWPDGSEYWCKLDLLVEYLGKIWIVDHKFRSSLPSHIQRLIDSQSLLYQWCARRNKIRVEGFIWNYGRMKPPVIPRQLRDGTLSRRKIETDYPTFMRALKDYEIDPVQYAPEIDRLRSVYWRPHKLQESAFWRREQLVRDDDTIKRMAREMYKTRKRMIRYNFEDRDAVERTLDSSCKYMCGYNLICSTDLFGGNSELVRQTHYQPLDPLGYYGEYAQSSSRVSDDSQE